MFLQNYWCVATSRFFRFNSLFSFLCLWIEVRERWCFGLEYLFSLPQIPLEISHRLVENIHFWSYKHGRRLPNLTVKHISFLSPQTQLEFVSLSRLKHLILLPLTQLEMSRHPCKNVMFVSPQTQYQANKCTRWNDVLSPLTPPSPPLHLQTWTVHHEHSMWYISWQVSSKILVVMSKMLSENLYDDPVSVLLWLSWSPGQPLRDSHQKTVAHQPKTGRIIISMFWCQRAKSEPFNTPSWLSLTFAHTLPSCLMCYSWQANQPTCRLTLAVQIAVLHSVCVLKVKSRVFLLKQKSS